MANREKGKITTRQLSEEVLRLIEQKAVTYVQNEKIHISYRHGGLPLPKTDEEYIEGQENNGVDKWRNCVAYIYPLQVPKNPFNKDSDLLIVYLNGIYLTEGVDYKVSKNSTYIKRINGNNNWMMDDDPNVYLKGQKPTDDKVKEYPENGNFFSFIILKGAKTDYGSIQGMDIIDGTIEESKLDTTLIRKINAKLGDEDLDPIRNDINVINTKLINIDPSLASSNVSVGTTLNATVKYIFEQSIAQTDFYKKLAEANIRRVVLKIQLYYYKGQIFIGDNTDNSFTSNFTISDVLESLSNNGFKTSIIFEMNENIINCFGGPTNEFFRIYTKFLDDIFGSASGVNTIANYIDHAFLFIDCTSLSSNNEKEYKVKEMINTLKEKYPSEIQFGFITTLQTMDLVNGITVFDDFDIIGIKNNPLLSDKATKNEAQLAMSHVNSYSIFDMIDKVCKINNKRYIVTGMGYDKPVKELDQYMINYIQAAFDVFKHSDYCDEFWLDDVTHFSNYNWLISDDTYKAVKNLGGR